MAGNKKKTEFTLNVGISSLLFIFVILCLVSFAILSLSSAMSDYRLSQRIMDGTTMYYNARNQAEEMLEGFDKTLADTYNSGISRTGYFEKVGKKKTILVELSDMQALNLEIKILYPEKKGDPFYEITEWKLINTKPLEFDETLPVFK